MLLLFGWKPIILFILCFTYVLTFLGPAFVARLTRYNRNVALWTWAHWVLFIFGNYRLLPSQTDYWWDALRWQDAATSFLWRSLNHVNILIVISETHLLAPRILITIFLEHMIWDLVSWWRICNGWNFLFLKDCVWDHLSTYYRVIYSLIAWLSCIRFTISADAGPWVIHIRFPLHWTLKLWNMRLLLLYLKSFCSLNRWVDTFIGWSLSCYFIEPSIKVHLVFSNR